MVKTERILSKTIDQKVLNFIDQYNLLSRGDRLLIALSGGPDSVFALHFFYKFKRKFQIELGAAHINHSLRGQNSDEDERFCKNLTEELKIPFFPQRVDVKSFSKDSGLSIEEAARNLRYNVLKNIAQEQNFVKIVTAHNMSDNAETVLLNLFKGTGLKGISGIPPKRENIVRPLLSLSKQEILEYLQLNGIPYRIDESNLSNDYQRNFIRNVLLPEIKNNLNPAVENNLFNSSVNFRNAKEIIDFQVSQIIPRMLVLSDESLEIKLDESEFISSPALGEVLKKAIEDKFKVDFSFGDLLKIRSLIENQAGRKILLSGGLAAYRERISIIIRNDTIEEFSSVEIKIGETKEILGKYISVKDYTKSETIKLEDLFTYSNGYREFISFDSLEDEFVIRRWQPGDKFIPLGMHSYKKISDFLTEQKLLVSQKKKQLVLTNRDKIIWIPGLRIDDRYKITEKSKRILELCLE
ncbi:MAG: tRNA lysidine(34) synthetase TilS [Clostridiales bacterium]